MYHLQNEVFSWVSHQPGITGLVIFGAGLAYAFFGLRLFLGCLAIACAGIGWIGGMIVASLVEAPVAATAVLGTLLVGLTGVLWRRFGVFLACVAVGSAFAFYIADQLRVAPIILLVMMIVGGAFSGLFAVLCPRTMPILLMTAIGTTLLVIGFVGVSSRALPEVGQTFRDFASSLALLVPFIGGMVGVASYSFLSMNARGDIMTGT